MNHGLQFHSPALCKTTIHPDHQILFATRTLFPAKIIPTKHNPSSNYNSLKTKLEKQISGNINVISRGQDLGYTIAFDEKILIKYQDSL